MSVIGETPACRCLAPRSLLLFTRASHAFTGTSEPVHTRRPHGLRVQTREPGLAVGEASSQIEGLTADQTRRGMPVSGNGQAFDPIRPVGNAKAIVDARIAARRFPGSAAGKVASKRLKTTQRHAPRQLEKQRPALHELFFAFTEYGIQHGQPHPDYLPELGRLADFIETFPNVSLALSHQIPGHNNKLTAEGNEFMPEGNVSLQRAAAWKKPPPQTNKHPNPTPRHRPNRNCQIKPRLLQSNGHPTLLQHNG